MNYFQGFWADIFGITTLSKTYDAASVVNGVITVAGTNTSITNRVILPPLVVSNDTSPYPEVAIVTPILYWLSSGDMLTSKNNADRQGIRTLNMPVISMSGASVFMDIPLPPSFNSNVTVYFPTTSFEETLKQAFRNVLSRFGVSQTVLSDIVVHGTTMYGQIEGSGSDTLEATMSTISFAVSFPEALMNFLEISQIEIHLDVPFLYLKSVTSDNFEIEMPFDQRLDGIRTHGCSIPVEGIVFYPPSKGVVSLFSPTGVFIKT